jgi:hypothetical protein
LLKIPDRDENEERIGNVSPPSKVGVIIPELLATPASIRETGSVI